VSKRFVRALVSGLLCIASSTALTNGEYCPDYQRENKELAREIKEDLKAYARSQGVPERLLYLYDQLGDCLECLGGDREHPILPVILIHYVEDANPRKPAALRGTRAWMTGWSADLEYRARHDMRDGFVQAFYIMLETVPCSCCTASTQAEYDAWNVEPDPTTSPTWDPELKIDPAVTDAHQDPATLGADPKDLTELPDEEGDWEMAIWPDLRLPQPVRPLTTLCVACRDSVNQYNDQAVAINRAMRTVARLIGELQIVRAEITRTLRKERAVGRLAHTDQRSERLEALQNRYGDLVASDMAGLRRIREAEAAIEPMLEELARRREVVTLCERQCAARDAQPVPDTLPERAPMGPGLPPYTRIASQVCSACQPALDVRNDLARQMNALVDRMSLDQVTDQMLSDWNVLREELVVARENLRACLAACATASAATNEASAYLENDIGGPVCIRDLSAATADPFAVPLELPASCSGSYAEQWYASEIASALNDLAYDRSSQNPNDPFFGEAASHSSSPDQWGLRQILTGAAGKLIDVWSSAHNPVVVAIVDSGLDWRHPDLAEALFVNEREIESNGIDDDGNGFIDDVRGWNFVAGNADVSDTNGHGTMVAGIIAAAVDNAIGIAGVNPAARLLPVKVTNFLGRGHSSDVAKAVRYAVAMGARVINISLGGVAFSQPEHAAIAEATRAGALVVVASGNQNMDASGFWPAAHPDVITVAATDRERTRAVFSNWGSPVRVAAPGVDIVSLRSRHTDMMAFASPSYVLGTNVVDPERLLYRSSGTSFAAPFVTGVASLLLSADPALTTAEIKRMILQSARDAGRDGVDEKTGYGIVDAESALHANPGFYVEAFISGVDVVSEGGQRWLRVLGTAMAEKFQGATVLLGRGADATELDEIAAIEAPVAEGELARVPVSRLTGSRAWSIVVVSRHANGRFRSFRFLLNLG
jgi:hypothetical protein